MRQGSLFDIPDTSGTPVGLAGMMPSIRAEMHRVAAGYEPGRKMLVDAVNEVARREAVALSSGGAKSISPEILDKWLQSQERGHAPSLEAIVCFCLATRDASPLRPVLEKLGLRAVTAEDLAFLEYGKAVVAEREARERKRKLEARL